jgi:hypothetical protein
MFLKGVSFAAKKFNPLAVQESYKKPLNSWQVCKLHIDRWQLQHTSKTMFYTTKTIKKMMLQS